MEKTYRALVVRKDETSKKVSHQITELSHKSLNEGEIKIAVKYSSLNYKDALSLTGHPGVTRKFPHVPGIDAAGIVIETRSPEIKEGTEVIVTGSDLGMNTHGGLGEVIIVPQTWAVPKPKTLTLKEAMELGTAGFTAAQCVQAIHSLVPTHNNDLPVIVSGATGGVGSIALALLHNLNYPIQALSRKAAEPNSPAATFLTQLCNLSPDNILDPSAALTEEMMAKPLLKETALSAIDTVGGDILAYLLKVIRYRGGVAACGLAKAADLNTTVYPFILRGVSLIGIDSAACPYPERLNIWEKLSSTWKLTSLSPLVKTISLEAAPSELKHFLTGSVTGRIVVEHKW
ncbi:hypothetical protein COTS27_01672 [Spirochaetota bacterium]|nr:hypothetical protein COTS27_01672 [Spirochaetota bacterium]